MSALDVISLHDLLDFGGRVTVFLRLSLLNIMDAHLIADKLRGRHGPVLHLRDLVDWVQRVRAIPDGRELDTLRGRALDVFVGQVGLRLEQANVQGPGSGPFNVPILVRELLLVTDLRAVQSWRCP